MSSVYKINHTGTGVIMFSGTVPVGQHYRLVSVSCHFASAPTTGQVNFTITLDANAGAIYDLLLYTVDPSVLAVTDILWQPDEEIILEGLDQIDVAYANPDAVNYGAQITFKAV